MFLSWFLFCSVSGLLAGSSGSLFKSEACKEVVQSCRSSPNSDDFDFIDCVAYKDSLSEDCEGQLKSFTQGVLGDVQSHLNTFCSDIFKDCVGKGNDAGSILLCTFRSTNALSGSNILKLDKFPKCTQFVQRLKLLVFLDLGAMPVLLKGCLSQRQKFDCQHQGWSSNSKKRVDSEIGNDIERKGGDGTSGLLSCMQEHIAELEMKCRDPVLALSEIQAEDIKFDRQLFVHCSDERLTYCRGIASNQIYKCLMDHKLEDMTDKCVKNLLRHQRLIVQDYQVSRGLVRMCKDEIRKNKCRKSVSPDKDIRLAQILLCLENSTKNGTGGVSSSCAREMLTHRKILMEDYRLSPELMSTCSGDIQTFCRGVDIGGKTIHCLMEHTRLRKKKDRITIECQREIETLIKEVDLVSDWSIDPVLREACHDVVSTACSYVPQWHNKVMSCLMEKLGTNFMKKECESALLQIQYFVARNYKLDPALYSQCRDDAAQLCWANKVWASPQDKKDSDQASLVLPCLYRYTLPSSDNSLKLHKGCYDEVMRVMRERALSVQLNPDIEHACMDYLASNCNDKTGLGEEFLCLQDNLDNLDEHCKEAVSNFTELQSAHLQLNPIILTNCHEVMDTLCQNDVNTKTGSDILECLIEHKNDLYMRRHPKCRAAVEHHQLISLKDYHFTFRFKEACRVQVSRFCKTARSKSEVVSCLSKTVRDDVLNGVRPHIPRECRQQLRAQLLQQRENIDLNPALKKACAHDISLHCDNIAHGNARILECLELKKKNLTNECHKKIFNVEKQDLADSSTDYILLNTCRNMLVKYCRNKEPEKALDCLKKFKYEEDFEKPCRLVVIRRMVEQNSDYRLNPILQKDCASDISKYCAEAIAAQKDDTQIEGRVIKCLKGKFRDRKLLPGCGLQLENVLKEAALNYELNPLLTTLCSTEIKQFCNQERNGDSNGQGKVEECLKSTLMEGNIQNRACRIEIVELIKEGRADIQTDPLLYRACSIDINEFCKHIDQGDGRQLECMLNVLNDRPALLTADCKKKLTQRVVMYKIDPYKEVADLGELFSQVNNSPSKRYFIVVAFTFIGMIFITGMFCGRVMRRSAIIKNNPVSSSGK